MPEETTTDKENASVSSKIDTDLTSKQKNDEAQDPRQGLPSSVNVETGAPHKYDATERTDPKGQYIQYDGVALVRTLGPEEWKAVNVDSDDYFEWNYLNQKRIPRSSFSDEQLQYLLNVDRRFSVVNVDSEGKKVKDETPSETTK
jgi:hypothetical protein